MESVKVTGPAFGGVVLPTVKYVLGKYSDFRSHVVLGALGYTVIKLFHILIYF